MKIAAVVPLNNLERRLAITLAGPSDGRFGPELPLSPGASGQPVPEGLHLCTINPALICLNTFSCQPSTGAAFVSNALFAPS
jgi:hypothetical protein